MAALTLEEAQQIYRSGERAVVLKLLEHNLLLRQQQRQIEELQQEILALKRPLTPPPGATANGKLSQPSSTIPPYAKPAGKKRRKRPGRKHGHRGEHRPMPEHIDEHVEHRLEQCPFCKAQLGPAHDCRVQIVEDTPVVKPKTTGHTIFIYECQGCGQKVEAPLTEALPNSNLGLQLSVQTAYLHYGVGMSIRNICQWMKRSTGLQVSPGGLVQIWQRMAIRLQGVYQQLEKEARQSRVLHADETSWRVLGVTAWLWCFTNAQLAYFVLAPSRAAWVLQEVLGQNFSGVLVSDFYAVYGRIQAWAKQKCLVHLLREIKEVSLRNGSPEWKDFARRAKRLFRESLHLACRRDQLSATEYDDRVARMHIRLANFYAFDYQDGDCLRLACRLCKHDRELFTFLLHPEVPATNNHGERQIRAAVVMRKNSFGNQSWKGASAQALFMSIFRTCELRHIDPLAFLSDSLKNSIVTGKPLLIPAAPTPQEKAA